MGQYDFTCEVATSVISSDNLNYVIRVTSYWKNNNWNYNIKHVSSWVTCNGTEVNVLNDADVNTTGVSQQGGLTELGHYDFTIARGTSNINIGCSARLTSNSTYASGSRSSGTVYVGVDAKPSYAVSYNANGGSGAPGGQTKWYNDNLTLSSTRPTRTGYTFKGWATSSTGSVAYNPGATYSSNAALTLYAVWQINTWTVSYNANGGSGAPANQTKTYNQNLTLSSTKPTKTGYIFKGWATSSTGGVAYNPGGTYTSNAGITLYAVWEVGYIKPRITNFLAQRCNSAGTVVETGTYIKVSFNWATDENVSDIKIQYKLQTASSWTEISVSVTETTSGSISQIVGSNAISTDSTYIVRAYVKDSKTGISDTTTYSNEISLGTLSYPIDIKSEGFGIAFGKVSENTNEMDVGFKGRFRKNTIYESNAVFNNIIRGRDIQLGDNISGYAYLFDIIPKSNRAYHNQYIKVEILQRGRIGTVEILFKNEATTGVLNVQSVKKTGSINVFYLCSNNIFSLYLQKTGAYDFIDVLVHKGYYSEAGEDIVFRGTTVTSLPSGYIRIDDKFFKILYNDDSGTTGTVTLSETSANFKYLEIYTLSTSDQSTGYAQHCTKVYNPNGKSALLLSGCVGTSVFNIKICSALISGTQITRPYGYWEFNDSSATSTNYIGITKVLGYYNDYS